MARGQWTLNRGQSVAEQSLHQDEHLRVEPLHEPPRRLNILEKASATAYLDVWRAICELLKCGMSNTADSDWCRNRQSAAQSPVMEKFSIVIILSYMTTKHIK